MIQKTDLNRVKPETIPKLIIPIGPPGCGKSYHRPKDCLILSKDDLRFMLLNTKKTQIDFNNELEDLIKESQEYLFKKLLKLRVNIYLDATNIHRRNRLFFVHKAYHYGYSILYYLFTNIKKARQNNRRRKRTVPSTVFNRIVNATEKPSEKEVKHYNIKIIKKG